MTGNETPPKSKRGGKRAGAGRKPNTQTEDIASLIEALRPVRVGPAELHENRSLPGF
jgi:hypothetical protein